MIEWRWKGLFSMTVPDDWDVRELGDLLEFIPPDESGAAQISVLRRSREESDSPEVARELVENFMSKHNARSIVAEPESKNRRSATLATQSFISEDEFGQLFWDVTAIVWDDLAVICTYCHSGTSGEHRQSARSMYESIQRA